MTGVVRGLTVTVRKPETEHSEAATYTGMVQRILLNGNFELETANGSIIAHISEVIR